MTRGRRAVVAGIGFAFFAVQITLTVSDPVTPARVNTPVTAPPKLMLPTGSFVQPWEIVPSRRPLYEGPGGKFAMLREAGMDHVILQWAPDEADTVDWLFEQADRFGFDVWLGLARPRVPLTPEPYWADWADRSEWMASQAVVAADRGRRYTAQYSGRPHFAGLFVVPEMDNLGFRVESGRANLKLANLAQYMRTVRQAVPDIRLMMSPFVNAGASTRETPTTWTAALTYLMQRATTGEGRSIDVVALQDGFGPERHRTSPHMTTDRVRAWFVATRKALPLATQLWANIETYREFGPAGFRPATLHGPVADAGPSIFEQIRVEQGLVDKITTFSYLTYQADSMNGSDSRHRRYVATIVNR